MSYAIIRIQKFKRGAVKGIELHDQRAKDVSHTNPDIDRSKSSQNYTLTGSHADYLRDVDERLGKLSGKAIRKDAVVMCQALITSDAAFFQTLSQEQQRDFFSRSLDFLRRRYGEENILSATIHMDERTPHMHVNFTPIRDGKLSAFNIFTRQELSKLQTDFSTQVGQRFGLQRGESRALKRKHLDVADYKRATDFQLETLSISDEEAEAKLLKKGLLYSTYETGEVVADRLNRKYVWPLARALQEAQKEAKLWYYRAEFREKLFQEQQELEKGLSPERVERLRQGIKALSDALKREQQEERELLRTRQKTRSRTR